MLELPYPPSLNKMYRIFNGRFLISKVGRDYKKTVQELCMVNRVRAVQGPIRVNIMTFRPAKRGDIDNTLKVLLDSLQGHAYENDSQIAELFCRRLEDKDNPRVIVEILAL